MTTATQAPPTIKFTGLSPLTTALVRRRTQLLQNLGTIKVGRTVLTFRMPTDELDDLFDKLIQTEIPGSGASSKEVGRLRQLRRDLSAERTGLAEGTGVTITYPPTGDDLRERILDLLNDLWERHCDDPEGIELTDLADGSNPNVNVDYRVWLSDHL